jgi:hypothetical protein
MIIWDFSAVPALYLSFCLTLVIGAWVFYTFHRKPRSDGQSAYLKQCPDCGHLFLHYRINEHARCSRCLSYLD